jgi:cob(I)alamin adenosyltransferase
VKKRLTADEQQMVNMHDSLRTYKSRVASQERQIKRLLADNPQVEAEREIARLEQRCRELEHMWLACEQECLHLARQLQRSVA